jgi:hypothetical protein
MNEGDGMALASPLAIGRRLNFIFIRQPKLSGNYLQPA